MSTTGGAKGLGTVPKRFVDGWMCGCSHFPKHCHILVVWRMEVEVRHSWLIVGPTIVKDLGGSLDYNLTIAAENIKGSRTRAPLPEAESDWMLTVTALLWRGWWLRCTTHVWLMSSYKYAKLSPINSLDQRLLREKLWRRFSYSV